MLWLVFHFFWEAWPTDFNISWVGTSTGWRKRGVCFGLHSIQNLDFSTHWDKFSKSFCILVLTHYHILSLIKALQISPENPRQECVSAVWHILCFWLLKTKNCFMCYVSELITSFKNYHDTWSCFIPDVLPKGSYTIILLTQQINLEKTKNNVSFTLTVKREYSF